MKKTKIKFLLLFLLFTICNHANASLDFNYKIKTTAIIELVELGDGVEMVDLRNEIM